MRIRDTWWGLAVEGATADELLSLGERHFSATERDSWDVASGDGMAVLLVGNGNPRLGEPDDQLFVLAQHDLGRPCYLLDFHKHHQSVRRVEGGEEVFLSEGGEYSDGFTHPAAFLAAYGIVAPGWEPAKEKAGAAHVLVLEGVDPSRFAAMNVPNAVVRAPSPLGVVVEATGYLDPWYLADQFHSRVYELRYDRDAGFTCVVVSDDETAPPQRFGTLPVANPELYQQVSEVLGATEPGEILARLGVPPELMFGKNGVP